MTVIPATTDYTVVQGATFREPLGILAGATGAEEALDLTGAVIRFQIRPHGGETIELTVGNGGIVFDAEHLAVDGAFMVYLSATATQAFTWSRSAHFELEIQPSGGDSERWLEGAMYLNRQKA